jgi:hypothetical protein
MDRWNLSELRRSGMSASGTKHALNLEPSKARNPANSRPPGPERRVNAGKSA